MITFNKQSNNPFKGLKYCLELYQKSSEAITFEDIDRAWNEAKKGKESKEMFYSLLFSIGDITNRQHNIFKGQKIDNGGNANREGFWVVFQWLKTKQYKQFVKFMNEGLFNEYTCFDFLFRSRVKTKKLQVLEIYDMFSDKKYCKDLANYIYSIIKGTNIYNKHLVAKFLTLPRTSKRQNHTKMLPETQKVMLNKCAFLKELSKLMKWEYDKSNFIGYRNWRKQYNQNLESVLFSTGKIFSLTKDQFLQWFDQLPAQARFRVKNRIVYGTAKDGGYKYGEQRAWYQEWEAMKVLAQQEQRVLEEKMRQGQISEEELDKLEEIKKQAKVTVGATNFKNLYNDICNNQIDWLKMQSFLDKIKLDYNTLVVIDKSGSMNGTPFNFATFLAAVCLQKNPSDEGRNLLGFFSNDAKLYSSICLKDTTPQGSWWRKQSTYIAPEPFVDPLKSFQENYERIKSFCNAAFDSGGTYLNKLGEYFASIDDPELCDHLREFPVLTLLSDGDINNSDNARASMESFIDICHAKLNWDPLIVLIDIPRYGRPASSAFDGIPNMLHINGNVNQIEQFLTNLTDIDMIDVYSVLEALYRSNRYELVRSKLLK